MTKDVKPKVINRNHFIFSVNRDSFESLLAKANCRDSGKFSANVPINLDPPVYECTHYRFEQIPSETRDLRDVLSIFRCSWMDFATIRELLGFATAFPKIIRRGGRIIALGRDTICFTGGVIPAIRPGMRRIVLEKITYSIGVTLFTTEDRFLIRDEIQRPRHQVLVA